MKKLLSIILLIAMLCTSVLALTACPPAGGDSEINMDIDLSQKIDLSVLIPSSGKNINEINNNKNALLLEELTGYKVTYTQLPASDASGTLNTEFMNQTP